MYDVWPTTQYFLYIYWLRLRQSIRVLPFFYSLFSKMLLVILLFSKLTLLVFYLWNSLIDFVDFIRYLCRLLILYSFNLFWNIFLTFNLCANARTFTDFFIVLFIKIWLKPSIYYYGFSLDIYLTFLQII